LTALLVGELPHEQAAALHQKLAQDAELAKLYERLKHTISLVRETVASPALQTASPPVPLKLSEDRRQKLLQQFKTVAPKEFVRPRRRAMPWLVPVGIAASVVALLGALLLPALSRAKSKGQSFASPTWSPGEAAAPTLHMAVLPSSQSDSQGLNSLLDQITGGVRDIRGVAPAALSLRATPTAAKPASAAIVLPKATELADAMTPPTRAEVAGPSAGATLRRFYTESSGQMGRTMGGGMGGGGGFGGMGGGIGGGGVRADAPAPAARPEGNVAADSFFSFGSNKRIPEAGKPVVEREGLPALGEPASQPTPANNFGLAIGDAANESAAIQAPAAGGSPQTPRTSAYYGGGAYGGYSTMQPLSERERGVGTVHMDNVGDVPVTEPGPQSESKVAGITQGEGRSPNPQGMADDEAVLRQAYRNLSKPSDQKALGVHWYAAKSPTPSGPVAGQAGTPMAPIEQSLEAAQKPGQAPGGDRTAGDLAADLRGAVAGQPTTLFHNNGDGSFRNSGKGSSFGGAWGDYDNDGFLDLFRGQGAAPKQSESAPAFKSSPQDLPQLGDVAEVGRLFRPKAADGENRPEVQPTDGAVQLHAEEKDKSMDLGLKEELGRRTTAITLESNKSFQLANGNSQDANASSRELSWQKATAREPRFAGEPRRAKASPIILPSLDAETRLALKDNSAPEQQSRRLTFSADGRALQMADAKAVDRAGKMVNGPATGGTTERLAERRLTEAEAKGEPDEGKKVPPTAAAPVPQPETQTADNAFSTFSLNVSDVSFKLAAASLEKGAMPEPATVRSEEFINAFDYRDPEPPPGVPVAFAWERAQYPFAQNRDLLRFSVKTAALGRQPGRPLNIVLLLDTSGSMERADRVRIIHEALRVLAGQLQAQDKLSVVTFARTAHLWVDGVPGNQAAQVAEQLSGLTPEGGTNLEDAMNLAYQTALRHYLANGVNRVVLLTDGAANLGNVEPETLKQKVEANRKQGVALDCFGIGWEGYNDDLLEVLSRNGDGRYAFLNSPEEVASEFAAKLAGALQVAASDVKVQVEFNPARVTAYRQIGYAKHQLTKEQFRDNTVNAAQIGAAEAGNALYTVEVNPAGTGPLCTVRVRFRIPGTADYREHAWDVPFTGNAVALDQASPAMRLAATASAFSEWLASSPYAGEVTPDRLLGYLSGVPEVYGADARPKKLEWMIRQAKSIAGK